MLQPEQVHYNLPAELPVEVQELQPVQQFAVTQELFVPVQVLLL